MPVSGLCVDNGWIIYCSPPPLNTRTLTFRPLIQEASILEAAMLMLFVLSLSAIGLGSN